MKFISTITLIVFFTSCNKMDRNGTSVTFNSFEVTASEPINDAELLMVFEEKVNDYMANHSVKGPDEYNEQLAKDKCIFQQSPSSDIILANQLFYQKYKKSVLMVGIVYDCGNCPKNHVSVASGFVLTEDGICATNYHVFQSYDPSHPSTYKGLFVMDSERNLYAIKEVLAASKQDDLAIFKIDTDGHKLYPLAIGDKQEPGASIHLISHPDNRLYTYTSGQINRHYIKPGTSKVRQSISAEFANGSSGAPVMDDCGNLVGVVAGTQNIYYGPNPGIYQMTVKEIIPVDRIKNLIKK